MLFNQLSGRPDFFCHETTETTETTPVELKKENKQSGCYSKIVGEPEQMRAANELLKKVALPFRSCPI